MEKAKPWYRRIFCGNFLRLTILLTIAASTGVHVAVIVLPNWWKLDYAKWKPRNTVAGFDQLNGGLWRMCQIYLPDAERYLDESRPRSCFYYGQLGNTLHLVATVGHVENWHVRQTRGCMIMGVLLNFFTAILVAVACKIKRKRIPMLLVFMLQLAQCMLLIGAVVTAHNWITAGTWRDINGYDFAFYWTCYLIAPYFCAAMFSLWSACTAYSRLPLQRESGDDSGLDQDARGIELMDQYGHRQQPTQSARKTADMTDIADFDDTKRVVVQVEPVGSAEV